MSDHDTPFYLTRMGRQFFDRDVPALVAELRQLNANLARLATALGAGELAAPAPAATTPDRSRR